MGTMGSPLRRILLAWNVVSPFAAVAVFLNGQFLGALALLASAHWPWLYATLLPRCGWWGPQTRRVDAGQVWLTIDDGPDPEDTPRLLDLLDAAQAKATFFVIGDKARQHPELVRLIAARGHEIGNHTQTHPSAWFWAALPAPVEREVALCQVAIAEAGVPPPRWFRAPAGLRNHFLHPVLTRHGLRLAGWSARGFDGVDSGVENVLRRLLPGVRSGAVVLMHEGRAAADGGRLAPRVLEAVLAEIRRQDLRATLPTGGCEEVEQVV